MSAKHLFLLWKFVVLVFHYGFIHLPGTLLAHGRSAPGVASLPVATYATHLLQTRFEKIFLPPLWHPLSLGLCACGIVFIVPYIPWYMHAYICTMVYHDMYMHDVYIYTCMYSIYIGRYMHDCAFHTALSFGGWRLSWRRHRESEWRRTEVN